MIATGLWYISNNWLMKPNLRDQDVEWGFCFDVHLNAFIPILVILHFVQLFVYHAIIGQIRNISIWTLKTVIIILFNVEREMFVATLLGNSLWLVALSYYIYITFLGYSSLNLLTRTHYFLAPLTLLAVFFILTLCLNWNLSNSLMYFYKYRVL